MTPGRSDEDGPQRSVRIQLRLTPDERAEIERRAAAEHRTVSEYLRWRALADFPVHPPAAKDEGTR